MKELDKLITESLTTAGSLFSEKYLKKFRVFKSASLFEPDMHYLRKGKCPICFHKLYWRADKKLAYCKSRYKDKFAITRETASRMGMV